jgi:hypothetical protein
VPVPAPAISSCGGSCSSGGAGVSSSSVAGTVKKSQAIRLSSIVSVICPLFVLTFSVDSGEIDSAGVPVKVRQ